MLESSSQGSVRSKQKRKISKKIPRQREVSWKYIKRFLILSLFEGSESEGITVEVCTDGSNCEQCGLPSDNIAAKHWAVFRCGKKIRGNQIKIIQNNNHLAFCEVKITGKKVFRKPGKQTQKQER